MNRIYNFLAVVWTSLLVFGVTIFMAVAFVITLIWGAVAWGCGVPITIKRNEQVIGYVRWFTYYDTHQWMERVINKEQ
jgi:hypothetical protein